MVNPTVIVKGNLEAMKIEVILSSPLITYTLDEWANCEYSKLEALIDKLEKVTQYSTSKAYNVLHEKLIPNLAGFDIPF